MSVLKTAMVCAALDTYIQSIQYLDFSGGGLDTIRMLGALLEMQEKAPILLATQIKGVAGCSAGAVIATLLIMTRFNVYMAAQELLSLPWHEYDLSLTIESLTSAWYNAGLQRMDAIVPNLIDPMLIRYCGKNTVTLAEFHEQYGVHLRVRVVDLVTGQWLHLDHVSHGTMPLRSALWASMGLPWIHEPVCWDGAYFVDGGLARDNDDNAFGSPDTTLLFIIRRNYADLAAPMSTVLRTRSLQKQKGIAAPTFIECASVHLSMAACCYLVTLTSLQRECNQRFDPMHVIEIPVQRSVLLDPTGMQKQRTLLMNDGRSAYTKWTYNYLSTFILTSLVKHAFSCVDFVFP